MNVRIKRVYEAPETGDGYRVLVDGVWPRGVSKAKAAVDEWRKEVAPSRELRRWFGHDPQRWDEFRRRYFAELDAADGDAIERLRERAREEGVTLVFAARDTEHNNAAALREYLEERR